ncbi:MAG: 2Fe-2S iron-sulfur cluster-binding protein, partial [Bacteroidota bacterium]
FRNEADGLFVKELNSLEAGNSNFHLLTTYSNRGKNKTLNAGRLTSDTINKFIPVLKKSQIYICGPDAMMSEMRAGLTKIGIAEKRIHIEAFTPPPRDTSKGGEYDVTFLPSDRTITGRAGETILNISERADVNIDYSCRSGTCGLCKAKLVFGEVLMEIDDALEEDEIDEGFILTCQSYPRTEIVIFGE